MPIVFRCRYCGQKLSVANQMAGRTSACPRCQQEQTVPIPPAIPTAREPRPHRGFEAAGVADVVESVPGEPSGEELGEETLFAPRWKRGGVDEMDLTPMVDVTFLLLIFFMITASFSTTKTIETPPPDPEKKGAQQSIQTLEELERTSIMVRIDEQDNILVDEELVADPATLEELFMDKLLAEEKNELVIQASPASRHETFVTVFDAGTGAGMQRIRLATSAEEE